MGIIRPSELKFEMAKRERDALQKKIDDGHKQIGVMNGTINNLHAQIEDYKLREGVDANALKNRIRSLETENDLLKGENADLKVTLRILNTERQKEASAGANGVTL